MINYQDERKHSSARRIVKVRPFPGATTVDLLDFCKPSGRKKPDVVIVHVGTNDLGNLDENAIARNILGITQTKKKISPGGGGGTLSYWIILGMCGQNG